MRKWLEQISWSVVIMLVIAVLPAFFTLRAPAEFKVVRQSKSVYYSVIPDRAVTLSKVTSYKDKELTEIAYEMEAQTKLEIKDIISNGNKKLFILNDDSYVLANTKMIGSDVTLEMKKLSTTVYITSDVNILYNPFTVYDNQIYTEISGNQTLQTLKEATTHWGTYYEVNFDGGRTGWVSSEFASLEDPKLHSLQQILNEQFNNSHYSITVKRFDSDFTVGVNQEKKMYSASLFKLPILYWTQKQINEGYASASEQLKYVPEVNMTTWGAFNPSGTGRLPKEANNQNYSLLDAVNYTVKVSDNVGSNLLAYHKTDKFSPTYRKAINELVGEDWDPIDRKASSKMVAQVIEALYNEGGICFNAMFDTDYDNSRIEAGIPDYIKVAHKIGVAGEYNHDAAIIFTSQPYILVIETSGNTSDEILTKISETVYEALK